jgi:hypothetical protein
MLLPLCSLAFAACSTKTSTSSFKGEQHDVAQTIANLQSDVTSGEQKKICQKDLAAAIVTRLGGTKKCESTVKDRVSEIDNTELQVEAVKLDGATASASVKSVYAGKKVLKTVSLAKEGGQWKISSLQ